MKTAIRRRQINVRRRQLAKDEIIDQLTPCDVPSIFVGKGVKFRVVLHTQVYENYGTHCCECESDELCVCVDYWKAKGGNEYKQLVGTANDVIAIGSAGLEKIVSRMRLGAERNDRFYREYLIGWSLVPTDEYTYEEELELEFGLN